MGYNAQHFLWFLTFARVILLIQYHLPLEKGVDVHLNKTESP